MADLAIARPDGGDVVELILDDHRTFEDLLRRLRDVTEDRGPVLATLSALLVAHAEAEEKEVYPRLRRRDAIDEHEVEHGEHEHDEGHEALLALLGRDDPNTGAFTEAVEDLSEALTHHLDEEERDILNPARTDVDEAERATLGAAFLAERARQLDAGCGAVANVRALVARAKERGD